MTDYPPFGPDARYAATTPTASLLWHHLDPKGKRGDGVWAALCGERRRTWEPVVKFADPTAFEPCQICVAIHDGMEPVEETPGQERRAEALTTSAPKRPISTALAGPDEDLLTGGSS